MIPIPNVRMATLTSADYRALLRFDFPTFAQRVFHELHPATVFQPNP